MLFSFLCLFCSLQNLFRPFFCGVHFVILVLACCLFRSCLFCYSSFCDLLISFFVYLCLSSCVCAVFLSVSLCLFLSVRLFIPTFLWSSRAWSTGTPLLTLPGPCSFPCGSPLLNIICQKKLYKSYMYT